MKPAPLVDVVSPAELLPFDDGDFDFVMSQEVLEHVGDPLAVLREMCRVLRPGGLLYLQVPFIIGFHPDPSDYWRFTRQGIEEIASRAGFERVDVGIAVGPATGVYRIMVEFGAVTGALLSKRLYIPVKAALALCLFPMKWLDELLASSPEANRIAGGYYVIARRP
jgi:SAM-dependent methyltransferase